MKKIAIYGKPVDNLLNSAMHDLFRTMKERGFQVHVYERYARFLEEKGHIPSGTPTFNRENVEIEEFAFLVSVGGDGTFLDTSTMIGKSNVPVIGINAGRLGFISSAEVNEMAAVCDAFTAGTLRYETRSMLQLKTEMDHFAPHNFALNELTVLKKDTAAMVRIDVSLNDGYLNSYWADGLIVSTPTGSTAYSLSCGGPIIMPGSENFVITPIAPHNLNVRPVVVSNTAEIKIRVSGRSEKFLMALDNRPSDFGPEETLRITRAPFDLRIIQPDGHSFLNTLRNKLAWGYDKRN